MRSKWSYRNTGLGQNWINCVSFEVKSIFLDSGVELIRCLFKKMTYQVGEKIPEWKKGRKAVTFKVAWAFLEIHIKPLPQDYGLYWSSTLFTLLPHLLMCRLTDSTSCKARFLFANDWCACELFFIDSLSYWWTWANNTLLITLPNSWLRFNQSENTYIHFVITVNTYMLSENYSHVMQQKIKSVMV